MELTQKFRETQKAIPHITSKCAISPLRINYPMRLINAQSVQDERGNANRLACAQVHLQLSRTQIGVRAIFVYRV